MKYKSGKMHPRRAMLKLSFAAASVLALGKGSDLLAADMKPTKKVIKDAESVIPGAPKIRLQAITFQPGVGGSKVTMKNSMICEITQGALDSTVDGKPVRRNTGDIYTCKPGLVITNKNNGETAAVMRIFHLLPA
jgi:quercetin dioxygenase-like cupin family protein